MRGIVFGNENCMMCNGGVPLRSKKVSGLAYEMLWACKWDCVCEKLVFEMDNWRKFRHICMYVNNKAF